MWLQCFRRRGIGQLLESLHRKVDKVMQDLTKLNESVDRLLAGQAAAADEMAALRDEIASLQAGTITQEQIDGITAKVTEAADKLAESVNAPDGGVGGTGAEEAESGEPDEEAVPGGGEEPAPGGATPPNDQAPPPAEGDGSLPAEGEPGQPA
jgi:hypothetical protein